MRRGEAGLPEERVRRALTHLGTDSESAPDVPTAVTARIGAALRTAPPPPAHTAAGLPRMSPLRILALAVGIGAVTTAVAVGAAMLLHSAPAARFPSGPTADKITVSVSKAPDDIPKAVVTRP
jgi:hypothetical protein